jgi:hypothetical protein
MQLTPPGLVPSLIIAPPRFRFATLAPGGVADLVAR